MTPRDGGPAREAKFVRFDYGVFRVKEFGPERPFLYREGPRPGSAILDGPGHAALTRRGLLVLISRRNFGFRLKPAAVVAVAKALRPIPASP